MIFQKNDAPILIVFGQSNAHGHATKLPPRHQINQPLKHVFGLNRENNQAYGLRELHWSGYTSFGMNLGETQDHTVCLATEFARMWQTDIDNGIALPDLYVIQISIGSQGIAQAEQDGNNMWYPQRERIMRPGTLGTVDISLYPLAIEILSLAISGLRKKNQNPIVLGLHWNQWETEVSTGGESIDNAEQHYNRLFAGFRKAVGIPCPIFLYQPLSEVYHNPDAVGKLGALFQKYQSQGEAFSLIDLSKSNLYLPSKKKKGIFLRDGVHYSPIAQYWFAQQMYQRVCEHTHIVSPRKIRRRRWRVKG